jgi:hypothetical protein
MMVVAKDGGSWGWTLTVANGGGRLWGGLAVADYQFIVFILFILEDMGEVGATQACHGHQ